MNIKRIIREEINDMKWIEDVMSNQDIAQEIADKTEIKDNGIHTPFSSLLVPSFPFRVSSFPLPSFFTYCEEQYGLNEEDSKDVWDRYKKIIKDKVNNLNESNDMDWIRDVQTNQDIAQKIADETKIKNGRLYPPSFSPLTFSSSSHPFLFSLPLPSFFTEYCKEQYGLTEKDSQNVWDRYKKIIKDRVEEAPINESDDLQWIEDVPNELPKKEKWVLVNDINVDSLEESELIQNYLFKQGFKWITGRSYYLAQKIYSIVANSRNNLPIIPTNQKGTLTYYGDSPHHIEEADEVIEIFKSEGKGIYYWSDIKPNVIMESNDMKWIEDVMSNQDGLNVYEISNIWKQYKKIIEYKIGQPKKDLNESDDMEWIKNISDTQLISSLLIYYSIDQLNLLTDVEKLLWDYRNKSDGKSYNTSSISRPGTIFGTYNEHKIKRWNDILKRENCIGVLQVIYNGRELHMIPIYNLEDYKERVNKFSKVLENNNYIGIIKPEDLLHGH